ncbi:AI-2E family transporter [Enemella evansiae]|uniref:AI-2E family transporter n=1 Tax=Enemella evansiae TaxID=2016499 RepID=UPI00105C7075|nr:AI-2E family transporter [Enemella evansiae]TDO86366.1 putative PurR-regulated permease PerM [Enemella evansiae]
MFFSSRGDRAERENRALRSELARVQGAQDLERRAEVGEQQRQRDFDRMVPRGVQIGAAWAWRLLLLAALAGGIGWLIATLSAVTIPLAIGIMLTAGLSPIAKLLNKTGMPRVLAALITLVGGLLVVSGVLTYIGITIAGQSAELGERVTQGWGQLTQWLDQGPLHINADQLNSYYSQAFEYLRQQQSRIATYAATAGGAVGNFLTGLVLALLAMFFMLYDGRRIWNFLLKLVPAAARQKTDGAGQVGWTSLVAYVRTTVIVAAVDAVGPLIAAIVMGVPMAPALGALLFLSAFVPIVGLLVSGFVVVLVTLVTVGWVQALIMLGVIILVNQLEGNVLQPLLMGKAVALHPMAVMFGITLGISVAGIIGALLVVPIMAFGKTFIEYCASGRTPEGVDDPLAGADQKGQAPAGDEPARA